jgi:hypothetical protein
MGNMDGWDLALLAITGYVAVVTLVRLMARHRDQVVSRFRHDMQRQQKPRKAADAPARRQAG